MQWVFLLGDSALSLHDFSGMMCTDSIHIYEIDNELQIHYENQEYIILTQYSTKQIKTDFEDSEYEELLRKVPFDNPSWFLMKYSRVDILKTILREDDFPEKVFIYCDGIDLKLEAVFDTRRIII